MKRIIATAVFAVASVLGLAGPALAVQTATLDGVIVTVSDPCVLSVGHDTYLQFDITLDNQSTEDQDVLIGGYTSVLDLAPGTSTIVADYDLFVRGNVKSEAFLVQVPQYDESGAQTGTVSQSFRYDTSKSALRSYPTC